MTSTERWIFQTFGRHLVVRWGLRGLTAGLITAIVFAAAAALDKAGYVREPLFQAGTLFWSSLGAFGIAVCSGFAVAYARRRRIKP